MIYAVANQKGGVGKTTTVVSLGAAFAEQGQRVLVIDLDPQAGLTISYGIDPDQLNKTVYQVFLEEESLATVTLQTTVPQVKLVPANLDLAGAEAELIGEIGWDRTLADALTGVTTSYDAILLNCPPTLGVLTTNALVAAHRVIVPLQCEYLALRALHIRPAGGLLEPQPMPQGPARWAGDAYVPRLITSPSSWITP